MKYQWSDYTNAQAPLIDSWLDDEAVRQTGIDGGWDDFFKYWKNDAEMSLNENYWCKIISYQGTPFAAIALSLWEGGFTVMEYIAAPEMRSRGFGSSALKELLDYGEDIIGKVIELAKAVIFLGNTASQRAFEKAGFKFLSTHPDGDALNYSYKKGRLINLQHEKIIVIDFGGQYNQLIARRVRECGVYCEVMPFTKATPDMIGRENPVGIIFTGGPNSVYDPLSPHIEKEVLELGIPILGICYGAQLMAYTLGGRVETAPVSEYGKTMTEFDLSAILFKDAVPSSITWMSHTDYISQPPQGFTVTAHTPVCPVAAMENAEKKLYAVQFHPEVTHTEYGSMILKNFVKKICGCRGDWVMDSFIESTVAELKAKIGSNQVILGLSGGVDSSVAAALLSRAVGRQLTCVFVDQGLMRKDEGDFVEETFTKLFDMNFIRVNCAEQFYEKLKGVTDPEAKRKIIGEEFYKVFWDEIKALAGGNAYFAQGTIYPDRIESGAGASGDKAQSSVIKTHHNMAKPPEDIKFLGTIEPLRDLFKDEVRAVGEKLGIPHELVWRQPFPGPGLGVRIIGEVTAEKVRLLQEADYILRDEMSKNGYESKMSQFFCVHTGAKAVGVMGDHRTYENVIAIRAITTDDFMTADWARIPYDILAAVSGRITNEVRGINRIVFDITSKPPATVEWE